MVDYDIREGTVELVRFKELVEKRREEEKEGKNVMRVGQNSLVVRPSPKIWVPKNRCHRSSGSENSIVVCSKHGLGNLDVFGNLPANSTTPWA